MRELTGGEVQAVYGGVKGSVSVSKTTTTTTTNNPDGSTTTTVTKDWTATVSVEK